jgi:acetyl/propionyl-CoA carboxylase alpha subunit
VSEPPRERFEVEALGAGRYLVVDGFRRRLAFGARSGGATWVFLDGTVHVIEPAAMRRRSRSGDREAALAAPMPATVLRVDVSVGQTVRRGDVMVVLEAMKMELPLKAPRDGNVTAVHCQPGDLVQPGVPLVELG